MQQRHAGRLVDAPALRVDHAVLDLVAHAEPMSAADAVALDEELEDRVVALAVDRDRHTVLERDRDLFGGDLDLGLPKRDAHDRVDDVHALTEKLEVLRFVRRTEHVAVRRVRLLGAHRVRQVERLKELAHLLAPTELFDELRVEPGLVDLERGVDEDAVSVEALDVVALVGRPIAEHVHVVVAHRADDRRGRHRPPERGRVEVLATADAQVERAALDRDDALTHHRLATVEQPCFDGAVLGRDRRDGRHVVLVGLGEVSGVGIDLETLAAHPRHGGASIEPARERQTDAGACGGKLAVDTTHARCIARSVCSNGGMMEADTGQSSFLLGLLCFLLFKATLDFGLFWWGRWILKRNPESAFWKAVKWAPVLAFTLAALAAGYGSWGLSQVFDAVALVEPDIRAQLLAQGISETLNGMALFNVPAFGLEAACLVACIVGTIQSRAKS